MKNVLMLLILVTLAGCSGSKKQASRQSDPKLEEDLARKDHAKYCPVAPTNQEGLKRVKALHEEYVRSIANQD